MTILKFPDPALFEICQEVSVFGPELKILLDSMWETMLSGHGVGLAANQVGLKFRMFTMQTSKEEKLFIVNPKIVRKSLFAANLREGCLSAPGEFLVLAERTAWVKVKFQDETGAQHERVFHDIDSVCIQHEIDHLDGKSHLQAKSLGKAKRKELAKKWGIKLK
jgi:peptide deformylase